MHVIQLYIFKHYVIANDYDFVHVLTTQNLSDKNDAGNGNIVVSTDKF
jgi:hypothetical protein